MGTVTAAGAVATVADTGVTAACGTLPAVGMLSTWPVRMNALPSRWLVATMAATDVPVRAAMCDTVSPLTTV